MKLSTTLASLAALALSAWAAAPTPPPARIVAPAYFQGAACPTPASEAKKTWKHGRPEYDAFNAAATAKANSQKAELAAAFLQKYPDSDYKPEALQLEMQAQAGVPSQQADAIKTATTLMQSSGASASQILSADVIIAYLQPTLTKQNDPEMAQKMQTLLQAATCGEQLLPSAPAAQRSTFTFILTKAKGFAQLNTKNYDAAIATLKQAASQEPTKPLPYYWMGIAQVTKATPDFQNGIFDLAKASVLSPQAASISSYLSNVYSTFHGSTDGLQDVLTAARGNNAPPAGFKILSKTDVENANAMAAYQVALEKQKNALPPEGSFAGIKARLERPTLSAGEWKLVKGKGYELTGIVTAITAKTADIAVGATGLAGAKADLHLILYAPLGDKRPKVGQSVTVDGIANAFKPNPPNPDEPFVLTMNQASIQGYKAPAPKEGGN